MEDSVPAWPLCTQQLREPPGRTVLGRLRFCKHAEGPRVLLAVRSQRHDRSGGLNPEEPESSYF